MTAAGYTDAANYYSRLHGLLDAVKDGVQAKTLTDPRLVVLGGESQYLFDFVPQLPHCLVRFDRDLWMLDEMLAWTEDGIQSLLDVAEEGLRECISTLGLAARILRKERAVGIIPTDTSPGAPRLDREQLEETVLITQQKIEMFGPKIPFCAFNGDTPDISRHTFHRALRLTATIGGNDVFVDIGDKSWGVLACRNYLGGIAKGNTLHVGDQFLSAGSNDFKVGTAPAT